MITRILCLALCLSSFQSSSASSMQPTVRWETIEFEAFEQEPIEAERGTFRVPENRTDPSSRHIELSFVRFASTSDSPGSPIVYLAGGPGGSGSGTAQGTRFPLFMALREFGDVIAFDQRGTGQSGFEELDCDDNYLIPFDQPTDRARATDLIRQATLDCLDRMRDDGIDVSAYNTRESAADLNDLRRALGAEKITLWGISYGTHLALATMKYHPDAVDRAILAGLEGLDQTLKLPSDQQALLEEIAARVARDPAASAMVPDLLGSLDALLTQLEAEPRTVEIAHPSVGGKVQVVVGKSDLQFAVSNMLRGPARFSTIADVVSRMEQGDWVPLALASGRTRRGEGLHAMSVAMDCASGASADRRARIAQEAKESLIADAINAPYPEICEGLGLGDLGDDFRTPTRSDVPTLLISGTLDGRTPVRNGEAVASHLTHAQHLVIEGAGHSDPLFLSSPKILESMQAFLRGERLAETRIEAPPVSFVTPRRVVSLSEDELDRFVGNYRIAEGDERRVLRAGALLFTRRGRGPMLPIRPSSQDSFFYEGRATHLQFQFDAKGRVTGMMVYHDGGDVGQPAEKID